MKKNILVFIFIFIFNLTAAIVQPKIEILPNSDFISYVSLYKENYSYNFNWIDYSTSEIKSYQVNGNYWLINYRVDKSLDGIIAFYKRYCQKNKGIILHSDNNNFYFKIAYPEGFISWVHVNAFDKNYKLNIVEQIDFNYSKVVITDSSKIKQEPDAVIFFDEKKIKIENLYKKELLKIINRMDKDRSLVIEIKAFASEDEGNSKANMQLSKKRLLQVKKELLNNGIPENRIYDIPYGDKLADTKAGNVDNEKQRRVELYLKPFE